MFWKYTVNLQDYKFTRDPPCRSVIWIKLLCNTCETPTQVFSCEYCKIFKNSFLHKTSLVAASGPVKNLWWRFFIYVTIQKMKFSIKDFFSKCDQIRSFLKKSLIERFIFHFSWGSCKIKWPHMAKSNFKIF